MKLFPNVSHFNRGLWILLTAFLGLSLSFIQDRATAQKFAEFSLQHLAYALSLQDDMGVIDWSKSLQPRDYILAFRATRDGQVLVEGGNLHWLNQNFSAGRTAYQFPNLWFSEVASVSLKSPVYLELVSQSRPGPLLWGLFGALCALGGIFIGPPKGGTSLPRSAPVKTRKSPKFDQETHTPGGPAPANTSFTVGQNFIIRSASEGTAELFGLSGEDLRGSHLLDLEPGPSLMKALGDGFEGDLSGAFLSYPNWRVSISNDSDGNRITIYPNPLENIDFVDFYRGKP